MVGVIRDGRVRMLEAHMIEETSFRSVKANQLANQPTDGHDCSYVSYTSKNYKSNKIRNDRNGLHTRLPVNLSNKIHKVCFNNLTKC